MAVTKGNKGTISGSVRKRGQGGLTKQERLQSKLDKAEQKMKELEVILTSRVTAVHEKLVNEYEVHIAFLSDVATGKHADATMANRIKCAELLIKRVDDLKEALEVEEIDVDSLSEMGEEVEGKEDTESITNLIEIDFIGEYKYNK